MLKNNYLVFIKKNMIQDTQGFINKSITKNMNIYDTDHDNGWGEISGPILVLKRENITKTELIKNIQRIYPNADLSIFIIIEYPADTKYNIIQLDKTTE